MNQQTIEKFIKAFYLKSKDNIRNGYDPKLVGKLIGIDEKTTLNVTHYLSMKVFLSNKFTYGDNYAITTDGIDFVNNLNANRTFKIIKFKKAIFLPPASKMVFGYLYWYDLINEDNTVEQKTIAVYASDVLSMQWKLSFQDPDSSYDAEKILLQFAKDKIVEKVKEGSLNEQEEITLLTTNQPAALPFTSDNLIGTKDAEFEIEMGDKLLNEEIMENKLAPSIIETRDEINAIFREKFSSNLLLLNQERNILDFFKTATSLEEFTFRVSSLAEVSRNLNSDILRKLTKDINEPAKLSVDLLELFLNQKDQTSDEIIEVLRNIGRIRQGYPNHIDNPKVIKSLQYFKLDYPVRDFENAWITLLSYYLKVLKQLFEKLISIP